MRGAPLDPTYGFDVAIDEHELSARVSAISQAAARLSADSGLAGRIACCLDLTSLEGNETHDTIARVCADAREPLPGRPEIHAAAVCVYPRFVSAAAHLLAGSGVRVATVAGFPGGPTEAIDREIASALRDGAHEIDAVITRRYALTENWRALSDEIRGFRRAAGSATLKVILATGDLGSPTVIARASQVALEAGADFLKTSTGKERVNAALPAGLVMARQIGAYYRATGARAGLKPSGGIRTTRAALEWLTLIRIELGEEWVDPTLFRIGASSLLADLRRTIHHD